jgi:hypothetical protein
MRNTPASSLINGRSNPARLLNPFLTTLFYAQHLTTGLDASFLYGLKLKNDENAQAVGLVGFGAYSASSNFSIYGVFCWFLDGELCVFTVALKVFDVRDKTTIIWFLKFIITLPFAMTVELFSGPSAFAADSFAIIANFMTSKSVSAASVSSLTRLTYRISIASTGAVAAPGSVITFSSNYAVSPHDVDYLQ